MQGTLARCVGDAGHFLSHHWSRAPLHRAGADGEGFSDLFSLADVDRLLSSFPRLPAFRLVRQGKVVDPVTYTRTGRLGGQAVPGVGDTARIYDEFHRGATIVLHGLQQHWPSVTRFCRGLELDLTHPVQANAYVTPPSARGLGVHHDTHDVFVLQLAGGKEWSIYEPLVELPTPSQPWSSRLGDPGDPILAVELKPGDCLYVPRGFPHAARSREEVTAHLTVGILSHTWVDVVRQVLEGVGEELQFRHSLPPGFAHREDELADDIAAQLEGLAEWLSKVDTRLVSKEFCRRFWAGRPPLLAGQLAQLASLEGLTDASTVRRREGAICQLEVGANRLVAVLGDRQLEMPAGLEPAMRRVIDSRPFAVAELADHLDGASRLVLVRRLVREGLLEVVSA